MLALAERLGVALALPEQHALDDGIDVDRMRGRQPDLSSLNGE